MSLLSAAVGVPEQLPLIVQSGSVEITVVRMRDRFTAECEAKALLARRIEELREQSSFLVLAERLSTVRSYLGGRIQTGGPESEHREVKSPSGVIYDIETEILWDDRQHTNVRLIVNVAELHPQDVCCCSDSLILTPDGSFIGD